MSLPRVLVLTSIAMIAFAGNSLLARVALAQGSVDAASFTGVRLVSGALVLGLIVRMRHRAAPGHGNWLSAFALFAYAAGFSFAYLSLPAASGALLLFGAVQATMIGYGVWRGERLRGMQRVGLYQRASLDQAGFWHAAASGALASGVGYAIWYAALPMLKATHAATVQLSVRSLPRSAASRFSASR